jgi:hypothetical protein
MSDKVVWWSNGRVVTRNSDGGTTAWSDEDAVKLHKALGEIIEVAGLREVPRTELPTTIRLGPTPPELREYIEKIEASRLTRAELDAIIIGRSGTLT